jgi:hypothetical protein
MQTELDAAVGSRGSIEFKSIRSFESGRYVRAVPAAVVAVNGAVWQGNEGRRWRNYGRAGAKVARFAVGVVHARSGATAHSIVAAWGHRSRALMPVFVVPEVLFGCGVSFVRTHGRSRRPNQLKREHEQHEDDDGPTAHGTGFYRSLRARDCSVAIVGTLDFEWLICAQNTSAVRAGSAPTRRAAPHLTISS